MKLLPLFFFVAVALADDQPIAAVEPAQDNNQGTLAAASVTNNDAIVATPIRKNDDTPLATTGIQAVVPQANNPQVPYPLYRLAYPAYPPAFAPAFPPAYFQRDFPLQPPQYPVYPVFLQPVEPETQALAQARQVSASLGGHLGPLGGGFTTGIGPSNIGAGFAFGWGGPYTYYGQNVATYNYPSAYYYPDYYRSLPPTNFIQPQQAILPQQNQPAAPQQI